MTESWQLIYERQTSTVTQYGLVLIGEDFCTIDGNVHISLKEPVKIKRLRFSYAPVFVHISPKHIIVASHYLTLLSLLKKMKVRIELDVSYAIEYLTYQCPWTFGTLCKQIQIVRNGEEISVLANGDAVRWFDDLTRPQNMLPNIKDYLSDELRKLDLEKTVFHISSGLDSSLLVLLASEISSPQEIRAISCETLGQGASDELSIVRRLAKDIGFHLEVADFKNVDVFNAGRVLIQQCLGYPIAHPSHLIEYLLDQSVSKGFNTIVSGRGADECLAGYYWHQPDYSSKEKYLARMRVTSSDVIKSLFKEYPVLPVVNQFESKISTYENYLSLHDRLEIDQRMVSEAWGIVHSGIEFGLNVQIAKPFQYPELSEKLFNLDDMLMVKNGVQKVYLRETMGPHYTDYLLNAPKRGLRLDLKPYIEKDDSFLDSLLESTFVNQFINKSELIKMHSQTLNGGHNYGWQLWSIFLLVVSSTIIYN